MAASPRRPARKGARIVTRLRLLAPLLGAVLALAAAALYWHH